MVVPQGKSIIEPDLGDVLALFKDDIFSTLNCVKIGQIQSFDGTRRTAQIQILFKRVLPDGTIQSLPLLVDCPVVTIQGGGGALQFPIAAGDQCLVLFSDRRLDEWLQNGVEAAPQDGRMHDLSDGIALVGVNALNGVLGPVVGSQASLSYQGSQVKLNGGGVNMIGVGGAEIDLQSAIVTIKNNATTMLTLLNGLITVIEGLQVNGPIALTAASVAALEAQKLVLATLLA